MKKLIAGVLAATIVLAAGTSAVMARSRGGAGNANTAYGCGHGGHGGGCGAYYVDAGNDGICDICTLTKGRHFIDNDGDGYCDNCDRKLKKHSASRTRCPKIPVVGIIPADNFIPKMNGAVPCAAIKRQAGRSNYIQILSGAFAWYI